MAERLAADFFGDIPELEYHMDVLENPNPDDIWANYDTETDSMVLSLSGKPKGAINVWLADDLYIMVNPDSLQAIGFYVEAWETEFVLAHEELRKIWPELKLLVSNETGWSQTLRLLAFWVVSWFKYSNNEPKLAAAMV